MKYIKSFNESNSNNFDNLIEEIKTIIHILQDDYFKYQSIIINHNNDKFLHILMLPRLLGKPLQKIEEYLEFEDRIKEICKIYKMKFVREYGEIFIFDPKRLKIFDIHNLDTPGETISSLSNYDFRNVSYEDAHAYNMGG